MDVEAHKKSIDLGEVFAIAWKRKWLIIIPLILVSIIAIFGSYMITPEYEASVIIWLGNPVRLSDQLQRMVGDAGNVLGEERHRSEELRSLQNEVVSTPYIQQLVTNLKLDQDPALDNKVQKIRASRPDLSPVQVKLDLLVNDLRDRISVGFAGWDQVRISVQSPMATRAKDIAQNLGEILMAEKMKQELGSVRMSQDFTYEQLAKYENDLQKKIDEKTNFERRYMGIQSNSIVVSDSNLKAINTEIEAINSEIEERKNEESATLGKISSIPRVKLVLNESESLKKDKDDIQDLLTSVSDLLPKYRWSDPEILRFKTRLYDLIGAAETEVKRLVEDQFSTYDKSIRTSVTQLFVTRMNLDFLYSKVNNLKLSVASLDQKVNSIPEYQAHLDQLNREITAARDLRDRFKEQMEGSQISQALLRESRFQIIEPAKTPLAPVKPNRPKIIIMGIALGLLIGVGAALLAELMDTTLKSVDDVEKQLGYPVLGVIPEISSLKKVAKS